MAINKRFYRRKKIYRNQLKYLLLTVHDIWACYLHKHKLYLIDNPMDTNDNFLALSFVHRVHQLYHFYKYIYDHLLLLYIDHFYRMDLDYMYEVDLLNCFRSKLFHIGYKKDNIYLLNSQRSPKYGFGHVQCAPSSSI
jgi:hypothetical protein